MKFIMDDEVIEEIAPVKKSDDRAIVHTNPLTGKEQNRYNEIQKEKIANDMIDGLGNKNVSEIFGVSKVEATRYSNGEDMAPDTRERVLSRKYEIQDTAVVKLMDTLKLLEPANLKNKEKIQLMTGLANVIDKMSEKSPASVSQVNLVLYSPDQKKTKDYDVIEVP